MTVVGFDSKEFTRGGFFAPLGVGARIEHDSFRNVYNTTMKELCSNFGIKTVRKVLDSNTIGQTLGRSKSIAALEFFFEKVESFIEEMFVFFCTLSTDKIPLVKMYGRDRNIKELPTVEYLRYMNPDFVHLCAWKYNKSTKKRDDTLLLDYFKCKESNASIELLDQASKGHLSVFPHGDLCNEYISTADLLAKLVDARLYRDRCLLNEENIKKCFQNDSLKVTPTYIGQPELAEIVPYTRQDSDFSQFIARPMYFVVLHSDIPHEQARRFFERSSSIDHIANAAYKAGGGYKFLDLDIDGPIIRDGNIFVGTASASEKVIDYISGLFDIKSVKAKDLRT